VAEDESSAAIAESAAPAAIFSMMKVSVFAGDIAEAPADAICTSTNPRLSLMMGTGGSVREKGGFEILRECEALLTAETARSGRARMPVGSVWVTGAGALPHQAVLHCVASDVRARSSDAVIRSCVLQSVTAAIRRGITSVAMPVFASGHAHFAFDAALASIAEALASAPEGLAEVIVVVRDEAAAGSAVKILRQRFPEVELR
jgi:O-acetyl-ADP-ribose deacetylase (regulator of RNase III)